MEGVKAFSWSDETVALLDVERRKKLTITDIKKRSAWRDRRLMALAAHKRNAPNT